ncbi:hypothetical protein R3P38DRAFT_3329629 [Favolaschia claudopus]|uniref:Uncharacterized protein n=1 Tax=Favolaschia claudopus TaxID=2862362 RepID=A0AAV9ZYT2_9AGAR
MAKTSRSGLSGAHRGAEIQPQRVPINKTGAEIKQAREKHKERIAALSFVQREAFLGDGEHDIEMADAPEYYPADGHLHSHAGKEATFHQIFDKCRPGRGDPRRRATRVQTTINAWREQIPLLTDTYLQLKAVGPLDSDEVQGGWEIEVIGFDVLKYGYLGASPEKVSLAFPIHLFEIYRQIHRVCPRYTISSLSTTLTNLHERPRRSNLARTAIIREADHWVDEALNRDEDWKVKNVLRTLHDEVSNSQKVQGPIQAATHPPPAVDPQPPSTATPPREDSESVPQEDDPDVAWLNVNELSASDTEELTKCLDTCARKKMFSLFAIPGIFVIWMKYPLALVKWILDKYGADIGLGYDIMCAFFKTLMRSSLGPQVVPAFHGHAHNHFEECERTFSKSNHLAASTRLATPFHRQQQIDEHFHFHDLDKHASSGNFIYQNYRQALEKITYNAAQLSLLEQSLDQAKREFKAGPDYNIVNNGYISAKIAQVRTRYRTTYTKLLAMEEELCRFEEEHSIVVRWDPNSQQYKDGLSLANRAKVERLVVQRLFELTKLGMTYNLRDKISKALKTRSEAIRRAITTTTTRPLPVIHMTSLAEFDILRDTRQDIRLLDDEPYYGIQRSKEEISRLNRSSSGVGATVLGLALPSAGKLLSTSRMVGFSGTIFPGKRVGRDAQLSDGVPAPYWLAAELGIVEAEVEYGGARFRRETVGR